MLWVGIVGTSFQILVRINGIRTTFECIEIYLSCRFVIQKSSGHFEHLIWWWQVVKMTNCRFRYR